MHPIACPQSDAIVLTATPAGTARVTLALGRGFQRKPFLLHNPGGVTVRVKVGDSSVTATNTSFPIGPGETQPFNLGDDNTHLAAWVASATQDVQIFDTQGV